MSADLYALEEVAKGDDKEAIEEKTGKLTEVAGKLAEHAYAQNAEQAEAGGPEASADSDEAKDENVVDAEFEEVDDDKK